MWTREGQAAAEAHMKTLSRPQNNSFLPEFTSQSSNNTERGKNKNKIENPHLLNGPLGLQNILACLFMGLISVSYSR